MSHFPAGEVARRSLPRKQSTRRLSQFNHLSSSEGIPSEHSSLYDAAPLSPSLQARGWSLSSETETEDDLHKSQSFQGAGDGIQLDPAKHVGTRLFTIMEQRSVPSLKTTPSRWELQRRVFSLQPKLSAETAQARHSRMSRRRCYSADDNIAHMSIRKSDTSIEPSSGAVSESQSPSRHHASALALAVEPPFQPPRRMTTPTGLPRWPGEIDHDQLAVRQLTVRTSRRDLLLEYLRRPPSRPKLKEVLRGERTTTFDRAVRTGSRFWRPPTSGQFTRRYEDLESHPFSFVPIADICGAAPAPIESTSTPYKLNATVHHPGGGLSHTLQESANSAPSALANSLQALKSAGQNAVPLSARRASARAGMRSAAVPVHIRSTQPCESIQRQSSQSPDIGTTRTSELFESFPSPPEQKPNQQRAQPQKRSSWSLFPAPGRSKVSEQVQMKSRRQHAATNSNESETSNVAVRGESRARYRHSGTPIYDPDSVSLHSIDQAGESMAEGSRLDLDRSIDEPQRRTESQRAVSNGALRFSTRLGAIAQGSPVMCAQLQGTENRKAIFRNADEPRQLCKHKLTKLRSLQKKHPHLAPNAYDTTAYVDGTSTPVPAPLISAQDYALVGPSISTQARASIAPVQHIDRLPTTTTFATAPNGATTFTTIPTSGPRGRSIALPSARTSLTMPGRA
ncbi:uncharacterized protein RCC_12256 [Ramularia collo-cygni]|uniref:Uncharacterized protein n=1 Tax=Ramularia collo-cygni TaxID=112498 RepID=A0A2D3UXK0_9PEZI|nr:uncharacterized protein RCC_12256 [Ramularia collo-cygni]CZT14854.1 uncharacterized protein RCC_12256 [Ramularia collo-cygni]